MPCGRMRGMDDFEAIAASAVPLAGGYGGETFAVSAGGENAVLKLYGRRPARAAVDASLMRLVRGLLPVPRVLDAMPEPAGDGAPPYVLYERLPGINLETYLGTAGDAERRKVGEQLGELLVRLSGMPFLSFGDFVGRELAIESFGVGELWEFFESHAGEDRALARSGRPVRSGGRPGGGSGRDRGGPVLSRPQRLQPEESARRSGDRRDHRPDRLGVRARGVALCGSGEPAPVL
jgi:hypothetical protein